MRICRVHVCSYMYLLEDKYVILKHSGNAWCLSAGCECEREIAISHVKPDIIYWLKMSKISDLENFAIFLHIHIHYAYKWWLFPGGGG